MARKGWVCFLEPRPSATQTYYEVQERSGRQGVPSQGFLEQVAVQCERRCGSGKRGQCECSAVRGVWLLIILTMLILGHLTRYAYLFMRIWLSARFFPTSWSFHWESTMDAWTWLCAEMTNKGWAYHWVVIASLSVHGYLIWVHHVIRHPPSSLKWDTITWDSLLYFDFFETFSTISFITTQNKLINIYCDILAYIIPIVFASYRHTYMHTSLIAM